MANHQPTDEEIVKKVQSGKIEDFVLLVERYEQKMMRYARRFLFGYEDAEDLTQNVFLKAYSNIQSFDVSRRFSPWIYRIAHNEFINAIKKKGKEPVAFIDLDTLFPHPAARETADMEVNAKETRKILEECLGRLSPKCREPLVLYYLEELDYKEISEILHVPVSTVGIRLKRGKEQMKKIYKQSGY